MVLQHVVCVVDSADFCVLLFFGAWYSGARCKRRMHLLCVALGGEGAGVLMNDSACHSRCDIDLVSQYAEKISICLFFAGQAAFHKIWLIPAAISSRVAESRTDTLWVHAG